MTNKPKDNSKEWSSDSWIKKLKEENPTYNENSDEHKEWEEFHEYSGVDFSKCTTALHPCLKFVDMPSGVKMTRENYLRKVYEAQERVKRMGKGPHPKGWVPGMEY